VTASDASDLVVVDQPEQQRYVARLGDRVVGFAEYRNVQGRTILFHTEVDPSVEGRGVGSRLASGVLDDLRARGRRVTIKCPFIAAYVARHPEYADLPVEAEAGRRTAGANQTPG
jgi:predicted GNAT family acetyltransferase